MTDSARGFARASAPPANMVRSLERRIGRRWSKDQQPAQERLLGLTAPYGVRLEAARPLLYRAAEPTTAPGAWMSRRPSPPTPDAGLSHSRNEKSHEKRHSPRLPHHQGGDD